MSCLHEGHFILNTPRHHDITSLFASVNIETQICTVSVLRKCWDCESENYFLCRVFWDG